MSHSNQQAQHPLGYNTAELLIIALLSILIMACSSPRPAKIIEGQDTAHMRHQQASATSQRIHTASELEGSQHTTHQHEQGIDLSIEDPYHIPLDEISIDAADSLWPEVRANFALQADYQHPRVHEVMWRYAHNQDYFSMLEPRLLKYFQYIVKEAKRRNMPLEVALLPVIESSLDPYAISSSRALGMWQFIASTGNNYGLKATRYEEPRRGIIQSTQAGLDHLQDLHAKFNDWLLAIAAYNAGPGGIRRAVAASQAQGLAGDYWSLDVRTETHNYVPKILALASIISDPSSHGIRLPSIKRDPAFEKIKLRGSYNLAQLAACAEMRFADFISYNARYNFVQTPNKLHAFLIPRAHVNTFKRNLLSISEHCRPIDATLAQNILERRKAGEDVSNMDTFAPKVATQSATNTLDTPTHDHGGAMQSSQAKILHTVKIGETLWRIAYNNDVSVADLKHWNDLDGNHLKVGAQLVIWK